MFEHDIHFRTLDRWNPWKNRVRMARHWLAKALFAVRVNQASSLRIDRHNGKGRTYLRSNLRHVTIGNLELWPVHLFYTNDLHHHYTHPVFTAAPFPNFHQHKHSIALGFLAGTARGDLWNAATGGNETKLTAMDLMLNTTWRYWCNKDQYKKQFMGSDRKQSGMAKSGYRWRVASGEVMSLCLLSIVFQYRLRKKKKENGIPRKEVKPQDIKGFVRE